MVPVLLFPEAAVREGGSGAAVALGQAAGCPVTLHLTITRMAECHTLDISIWGSDDGQHWGIRPLLRLPHRFYCGTYQFTLDLEDHPTVRYLRVEYHLSGWKAKRGDGVSEFRVTLEPVHRAALTAAG